MGCDEYYDSEVFIDINKLGAIALHYHLKN